MLSKKVLAKNTIWNLLGLSTPLLVAIFTIPLIVRGLGTDRYGILTIAWMVLGYFSLFDMGLGRALTKLFAEKLGKNDPNLAELFWTSILIMLGLGIVGAACLAALSPVIVNRILNIPLALRPEALRSFFIISLAIPFIICSTGLRGVLEAQQYFKYIHCVNVPFGIATYALPVLTLIYAKSLVLVVLGLFCVRALSCLIYMIICLNVCPVLKNRISFDKKMIRQLVTFGGWITVSNVISPLMVTFDRFIIGALMSIQAVAYYSTPYDVVTRILIISNAITGVLFPAFAMAYAQDRAKVNNLFKTGIMLNLYLTFPIIFILVLYSEYVLTIWIGPEFSSHSKIVLQLLSIGVYLNGVARFPFSMLQGIGRSDLTAKVHIMELPLYLTALLFLIQLFGINGAAFAWMLRATLDMVLMFIYVFKSVNINTIDLIYHFITGVITTLILFIAIFITGAATKIVFSVVVLLALMICGFKYVAKTFYARSVY